MYEYDYTDLVADAMERELEEHGVWNPDGDTYFESRFCEKQTAVPLTSE